MKPKNFRGKKRHNIVLKIRGKIYFYFRKFYVRKEPFPFSGSITLCLHAYFKKVNLIRK